MNILSDTRNMLLRRREILAVTESSSTPSSQSVVAALTEKLKVPAEQVVVKSVKGNFGQNKFSIEVFVYDAAADKELIEPKKKVPKKEGENK